MLQGLCVNGHTPVPWGMTVSQVSSTLHMTEPLLLVQLENFFSNEITYPSHTIPSEK